MQRRQIVSSRLQRQRHRSWTDISVNTLSVCSADGTAWPTVSANVTGIRLDVMGGALSSCRTAFDRSEACRSDCWAVIFILRHAVHTSDGLWLCERAKQPVKQFEAWMRGGKQVPISQAMKRRIQEWMHGMSEYGLTSPSTHYTLETSLSSQSHALALTT